MEIVCIFVGRLYSCWLKGESRDELERVLELWTDIQYLYEFVKGFRKELDAYGDRRSTHEICLELMDCAEELEDMLLAAEDTDLDSFFVQLDNAEYRSVFLSRRKGKRRYLRIYAIKVDTDCYLVTGGAIKLTRTMQESEHTLKELQKLSECRDFLKLNGVFDRGSFVEFMNE